MIKKSLMIGSLAAIFLLSGCDSSSVSDNLPDRPDTIETETAYIVVNNLREEVCTDRFFQEEMQEEVNNMDGVWNLVITSEPNAVNCETYGRTNRDADLCHEFDARMQTVESCVITAEMDRDAIDEGKYEEFVDITEGKYEDFIDIVMDEYL